MTLEDRVAELTERLAKAEAERVEVNAPIPVRRFWRRKRWVVTAALAAGLLAGGAAYVGIASAQFAEPTRKTPYRGVLEQDSVPVTDPAVPMQFNLYASAGDATPVWSSDVLSVPVKDGAFGVELAIPEDKLADESPYLAISVGGTELQGRQRLLSVPYALRAQNAVSATNAAEASHAASASHADNAAHAVSADGTPEASHATTAGTADAASRSVAGISFEAADGLTIGGGSRLARIEVGTIENGGPIAGCAGVASGTVPFASPFSSAPLVFLTVDETGSGNGCTGARLNDRSASSFTWNSYNPAKNGSVENCACERIHWLAIGQ